MVPTVPDGKALVQYGRKTRPGGPGFRVVTKGGASAMPIIDSIEFMDIGPQNIELDHRDVKMMSEGVDRKASLRATAIVSFLPDENGINLAVQHLLHVGHSDVGRMAERFTEAHARSYLRNMDINEATADLMKTAVDVQKKVQKDMNAIGVTVDNLTIHELKLRGG